MRPIFIFIEKEDQSNIIINANTILYYHLIGLNPGLGTELFFSNGFSIRTRHDSIDLEKLIREAIEKNNKPIAKYITDTDNQI
jgi:hypothetical protein